MTQEQLADTSAWNEKGDFSKGKGRGKPGRKKGKSDGSYFTSELPESRSDRREDENQHDTYLITDVSNDEKHVCIHSSCLSAFHARTVDLRTSPTHAVLDLGCTRAMGSRFAVNRFCEHASKIGLKWDIVPSPAVVSFANS